LAGIGSCSNDLKQVSQHCPEVSKIEIGVRRGGGDLIEPLPDHGEGSFERRRECSDVMVKNQKEERSRA